MSNSTAENGASSYSGTVVAVNAVISVAVALGLVWVVNGFDVFYERLDRVSPTVDGGGIGSAFVEGNEMGWLVFMVDAIHAIDVIMGLFILVLVFVHWGAFRRLAGRMRQPGESRVATDGGSTTDADGSAAENGGDSQ